MTFAEKLKSIRKQAGMSQEQLAEKLGVSRQAVTKWETNAGISDIENMMAISGLFGISIDELLSNEKVRNKPKGYLYESITEYDIAQRKHLWAFWISAAVVSHRDSGNGISMAYDCCLD
jgi:transcriptional regulator with XRE-family HTH domain